MLDLNILVDIMNPKCLVLYTHVRFIVEVQVH